MKEKNNFFFTLTKMSAALILTVSMTTRPLSIMAQAQGQAQANQCIPIEKMVDILYVTNEGFTATSHTYRTTVGVQKSKTATAGSHSETSQTRDSESSRSSSSGSESNSQVSGGVNLGIGGFGVNAGGSRGSSSSSSMQQSFSQRIGSSSSTGYNWESTDSSMFNEETTKEDSFSCEARSRCVVTQLVGKYCDTQIKVPFFIVKRLPLIVPTAPSTTTGGGQNVDISIQKPGEVWILARNLTFETQSGVWESPEVCGSASFVNGFQFKATNWTGLTGIAMKCATRNETSDFETVKEIQSGAGFTGSWYAPFRSQSKREYAHGFVFQTWTAKDGHRYKGNWRVLLKNQKSYLFLPRGSHSVETTEVKCPEKQAVCGLMTMLDGSKSVITNLGLKCCYYCLPRQRLVTKDSFRNEGDNPTSHTVSTTVGTKRELSATTGGQNGTDSSVSSEGKNLAGVQAGFAAQFGSTNSQGFNWGSTSQSMWNMETVKSFNWVCSPHSECAVKQLVGYCGEFEILTPHTVIESKPI